jgi:hypothetical protein
MTIRRKVATLTAAVAIATGGLLTAGAQATTSGGPDNVVWSKTTGTNAVDQGASTVVGYYAGDDLTSTNVARSESTDCTDCRTTAVAVQAVFTTNNPSTVEPTNAAIALNQNCLRCTTFAFAYQYVVNTDGPFHLSHRARRQISGVRQQIYDVAHSDLPPDQMDAQLGGLAAEFKSDIDDDLARAHERHHGHVETDEHQG